ncbi:TPA: winged helix-turn-helix transcriptional regulator [Enterococcus faecium]|nr:winged helix-turn-helix transcriptional regulator [Enterococcus faecium]HAQ0628155.1 winged helix-turn-helix transcriptional regulator [Enterococcus faecium]
MGIEIFPKERKVKIEGKEVRLSRFEFDVLLFFVRHPGWVFTRKQIYEAVWDDIPVSVDAKVECMIYSIRKKLRAYTDREYIQTVWGVGYKFDPGT